jgi:hypothetical protein
MRLQVDSYAYLPANMKHSMTSDELSTLVIFERRYSSYLPLLYKFDVYLPFILDLAILILLVFIC